MVLCKKYKKLQSDGEFHLVDSGQLASSYRK
jgi:hypothetical protein